MTSRLTLCALVFSILSTAVLVQAAEARTGDHVDAVRTVQLERVVIVGKRIAAD